MKVFILKAADCYDKMSIEGVFGTQSSAEAARKELILNRPHYYSEIWIDEHDVTRGD